MKARDEGVRLRRTGQANESLGLPERKEREPEPAEIMKATDLLVSRSSDACAPHAAIAKQLGLTEPAPKPPSSV